MWNVDRPERREARQNGDGNMKSHSQRRRVEGPAAPGFTTVVLNSLEVAETLHGRTLRVVWPHSLLNVSPGAHGNVEAQFCLNFTGNLIWMPAGVKET